MPKSICIAAGHGGFDSGAVGNGVEEKNINLAVSLALEKLLTAAGIHVVMTRITDEAAGGATNVQADLTNQCQIANDAKVDLFFTIHANASNASGAYGAEAYVMPSDAGAAQLAQKCVEALSTIVGTHGQAVKDGSRLWVIHNTNMPAILVELGFVTNPTEANQMSSEPGIFAEALAGVLIPYLGGVQKSPAPTTAPAPAPEPAQPTPIQPNPPLTSQYVTELELTQKLSALSFVTPEQLAQALSELKKELVAPLAEPAPAQEDTNVIATGTVLDKIPVQVVNNGFFFDLPVSVSNPSVQSIGKLQFDTGAFEIMISKSIADDIGLPNLGATQITGIGGTVDAYNSTVNVVLGGKTYPMPCVVDPSWSDVNGAIGLFGLRGLKDNHIEFDIDLDASTVTLYQKA